MTVKHIWRVSVFFSSRRRHTRFDCDWKFRRVLFRSLLFVIGLELEPKRLWNMRAQLLGLGLSQVLGSVAAITLVGWALGFDLRVALIAGMALSLSSRSEERRVGKECRSRWSTYH